MRNVKMLAFVLLAALLFAASTAWAGPFLVSDPAAPEEAVTSGVYVEMASSYSGTCSTTDLQGKTRTPITVINSAIRQDLQTVGSGVHSYCVAFVNVWGEGTFAPFRFTRAAPAAPSVLRISP